MNIQYTEKTFAKQKQLKKKKFNNEDYYLLRPIKNKSLKISTPVTNKNNKIRDLIKKEEINSLIKKIPSIEIITTDDKFIENEYKKLLTNGTHEDLIKVIKTTYLRNKKRLDNNKKIAEKDKSFFELAEEYLYNELSIVLEKTYEETKEFIINEVKKIETK